MCAPLVGINSTHSIIVGCEVAVLQYFGVYLLVLDEQRRGMSTRCQENLRIQIVRDYSEIKKC
jgi:hypothetical protein